MRNGDAFRICLKNGMIPMYNLGDSSSPGFENMSSDNPDEPNNESKPLRQKPESPRRAPLSDSNLTAAQRTARELYQPPRVDGARANRSIYESAGDLAAPLHSKDAEVIGS